MDRVYFLLGQMTHLRYFVPLVEECSRKNIDCYFLIYFSFKYNCPGRHDKYLNKICNANKVKKIHLDDFAEQGQTIICIEPKSISQLKLYQENDVYVLTSQFDYMHNYDYYESYVKNVIFPSKWFIEKCSSFMGDKRISETKWTHEKITSPKNVFLGSPKYDVTLDKKSIINKYNLTEKSKVLFFFPAVSQQDNMWVTKNPRGLSFGEINDIYKMLKSLDFEILVKSRLKHLIPQECNADRIFYDESWFPHTSAELIEVCDLAIMVDSTSIVECVLQKTPFINIGLINEKIRINAKNMTHELMNYDFCESYDYTPKTNELKDKIKYLTNNNFDDQFDDVHKNYLFEVGSSSKKIIDFIETQNNND